MQLIHCALSSRSRTVALDKERVSTFLWPHRCNALINANGGVGGGRAQVGDLTVVIVP